AALVHARVADVERQGDAKLDARVVEKVADQAFHAVARRQDSGDGGRAAIAEVGRLGQLRRGDHDHAERVAQIVPDDAEYAALELYGARLVGGVTEREAGCDRNEREQDDVAADDEDDRAPSAALQELLLGCEDLDGVVLELVEEGERAVED